MSAYETKSVMKATRAAKRLIQSAACAGLALTAGQAGAAGAFTSFEAPRGYAAASIQSPVAFGGSWGSVGVGMVGVKRAEGRSDSSAAVALGLGDPDDFIGVDGAAVFSSLLDDDGSQEGFGDVGSFELKLHRNLGNYTAIAVGGTSLWSWGNDPGFERNNPEGYYGAVTHASFIGDHVLMLTGGIGKNPVNKPDNKGDFGDDIDLFGSAAYYMTTWSSLIAEYNGFLANLGFSVAPLPRWLPLTVTAGAADIFTQHNKNPRLVVAVSLGFQF